MADVAPKRYNTRSRSKPEPQHEEEKVVVAKTRARRIAAPAASASSTTTSTATRKRAVASTATTTSTATRTARRTTTATPVEKTSTKRAASSEAPRRAVKRATPAPEVVIEVAIPVKRPTRARGNSLTRKSPKIARTKKRVTFQSPSQHEINKENHGPKAPSDSVPKRSILTNSSVNVLPPQSPPKRATTPRFDVLEDDDELNSMEPILNSPHRRARSEPLFGGSINLSPTRNAPPIRPVSPVRIAQNLASVPSLAPLSSSQLLRSPVRPSPVRQIQPSQPILEHENDGLDLAASTNFSMPVRPNSGFVFSSPHKLLVPSKEARETVKNTPARRPPQTPAKTTSNGFSKTPLFGRSTPAPPVSVWATPARRPAIPRGFATNLPQKKDRDAPAGSLSVNGPVRLKLPKTTSVPPLDLTSFVSDNLFEVAKTPKNAPASVSKDKESSRIPVRSPLTDKMDKIAEADVEDSTIDNSDSGSEPGTPTPGLSRRLFDLSKAPSRIPTPVGSPKMSPNNSPVPSPTEEVPPVLEKAKEAVVEEKPAEEGSFDATQESTEPETDADGDSQMMDSPDDTPNGSFSENIPLSPTPMPKPKAPVDAQTPTRSLQGYGLHDLDIEESSNDTISTLRDSGAYLLAPITGQLEDFHLSLNVFSPVKPVPQREEFPSILEDSSSTPRATTQFSTPPRRFSPGIPIDPALLEEADRIEQEEANGFTTVPVKFSPNSSFSDQENKMPSSPESSAEGIIARVEMSRGRTPRRERQSTTLRILAGAVVFVDVHLVEGENVRSRFVNMLTEMGAKVVKRWDWSPSDGSKVGITHVVFKEGSPKTLERVRAANIVQCVQLNWVNE